MRDETDYHALYDRLIAEIREGAKRWRETNNVYSLPKRYAHRTYYPAPRDPPYKHGGIRQLALSKIRPRQSYKHEQRRRWA